MAILIFMSESPIPITIFRLFFVWPCALCAFLAVSSLFALSLMLFQLDIAGSECVLHHDHCCYHRVMRIHVCCHGYVQHHVCCYVQHHDAARYSWRQPLCVNRSGHNLTKLYDPPKVASPRRRVMVGQCAVSTVFRIAGGDPWVDGMDVLNAESGSVRQLGVTSIELCYRHGIFYVLQRCQSICQAVSAVILVEGL